MIKLKGDYRFSRSGSYEIETILDDVDRGTAIRCHLRDDCAEFSKEETIKRKNNQQNYSTILLIFYRNREKI
jgi:HSP90 family molecular chaperone